MSARRDKKARLALHHRRGAHTCRNELFFSFAAINSATAVSFIHKKNHVSERPRNNMSVNEWKCLCDTWKKAENLMSAYMHINSFPCHYIIDGVYRSSACTSTIGRNVNWRCGGWSCDYRLIPPQSFASDAMKFRSMTQHVMQFFSSSSEFTATWATPSPRAVDLIRSIFRSSSSVRGRKTHSICAIFLLPLPRHQPAENNSIKRPEIEVNFNFDETKEEVELFAI